MKVREIIALVEADGWYLVRKRGGHRQYKGYEYEWNRKLGSYLTPL